jgi:hypothetical protein
MHTALLSMTLFSLPLGNILVDKLFSKKKIPLRNISLLDFRAPEARSHLIKFLFFFMF